MNLDSVPSTEKPSVNIPRLAREGDQAIAEGVIKQFSLNAIAQTCDIVYVEPGTGDRRMITIGFEMVEMFLNAMRGAFFCGRMAERTATERKVVLNSGSGKFSLSWAAVLRLAELGHPAAIELSQGQDSQTQEDSYLEQIDRCDPRLVRVVEEMGEQSWGKLARLEIVVLQSPRIKLISTNGTETAHWDIEQKLQPISR